MSQNPDAQDDDSTYGVSLAVWVWTWGFGQRIVANLWPVPGKLLHIARIERDEV